MKRTILITIFLLVSAILFSQKLFYRAEEMIMATKEQEGKWEIYEKPTGCSILIIVDLADLVIELGNAFQQKFYVTSTLDPETQRDTDGDEYTAIIFEVKDNLGLKCFVVMREYLEMNYYHIAVFYADVRYLYICKLIGEEI